jgi:hypothetical protein
MAESKQKLNRMLSMKLYELGMEPHSCIEDGAGDTVYLNRFDTLARSIWEYALGRTEKLRDGKMKKHLPSQWAINTILDRIEGKVIPQSTPDKVYTGPTAAEKVSELGKQQLNDMVED